MNVTPTAAQADMKTVSIDRKAYHSPVLRLRGTLSALTQAVGTANGDAGQGMMI